MRFSVDKLLILLTLVLVVGCTTYWQRNRTAPIPAGSWTQPGLENSAFDEHIRPVDACSPDEERASFTLPPGFEIELFASEPQIGKPINLAFDAKGRLWVTQSVEYPLAAKPGQGHDRLTILEDRDHDGRADTFTPVLDSLNIPIGILPVHDGAISFSIPNVYRFTDADGDDRPETGRRLLGPFGYRDTHGMVNHLTRGFDGWIHACHGFTNRSVIAGSDGDSVTLVSGNTFRFRADGSRVEQTTFGRVNPFGLTFDDWGYLYSSDCHSSPLYQLIMGADYPTFGRPADGIGFAPFLKPHEAEATALAGLALSSGTTFPEPYRNNMFIGDVVKSRIYRTSVTFRGSSPVGKGEEDFLRSTDPWFRPTDVVQGPDGALYVADFYNRIIGHYEVPLDNPGRDHLRGRIWRITYKGQTDESGRLDWSRADVKTLLVGLTAVNFSVRMTVADQLVNRVGQSAVRPVQELLSRRKTPEMPYVHGLWILNQLGALPDKTLLKALRHPSALVRTHAIRIVLERKKPEPAFREPVFRALADGSPHVQRVAVEALALYPGLATVQTLVRFGQTVPEYDTHLSYTAKLCLRNLLRDKTLGSQVASATWSQPDQIALAEPMSGVEEAYAGQFLFQTLRANTLPKDTELKWLRQTARYLPAPQRDDLVAFIRQKYTGDPSSQYRLFTVVQQSIRQQGGVVNESVRQWGIALAERLIQLPTTDWTYALSEEFYLRNVPITLFTPPTTTPLNPNLKLIGFDLGGFKGVIRSPAFAAPASLSFVTINLNPAAAPDSLNRVQLRLADDTTQIIARQTFPKANDHGVETVIWDLSAHRGKRVYFELVDQSTGILWAGDFDPSVLRLPEMSPKETGEQQRFAIETAGESTVTALEPTIRALLLSNSADYFIKAASARALLRLAPDRYAAQLGALLGVDRYSVAYRNDIAAILSEFPSPTTRQVLQDWAKRTNGEVQLELLKALATSPEGKEFILEQVRTGALATRILVQPGLEDRMRLDGSPRQRAEFGRLTANLSPIDEARETLIQERLSQLPNNVLLAENGRQLFVHTCSPCHQIARRGGMVGPQLDGIGSWGSRALATKILDPNRNISEAFRTYTIKLKNGSVKTGLFRRDEAASIVYAGPTGEEFFVPKADIVENQASKFTVMPDHFSQTLSQSQFDQLMNYLLSVK